MQERWPRVRRSAVATPLVVASIVGVMLLAAAPVGAAAQAASASTVVAPAVPITSAPTTPTSPPLSQPGGLTWSIVPSPNVAQTPGAGTNVLSGVACGTPVDCWAAGTAYGGDGSQTLLEHGVSGAWTVVAGPPASQGVLNGVSCLRTSDCWAVGRANTGSPVATQPLAEHWDGHNWTISTPANTSASGGELLGVACAAQTDCWAVGFTVGSSYESYATFAEHWDGAGWSVVAVPSIATGIGSANFLNSVACVNKSDCWATGYDQTGLARDETPSPSHTLTEHWNGQAWSVVPSPDGPTGSGQLNGVACVRNSTCWSVGAAFGTLTSPGIQPLAERWDGANWSVVPTPNPGASGYAGADLAGVTCTSAAKCWAVGRAADGSPGQPGNTCCTDQTLAEHWDGTSWTVATTPDTSPSENNDLNAVTCPTPADCWSVGDYYQPVNGTDFVNINTLVEHGSH